MENDEELKTVKFDAVEATHVRLIALKGVGEFASAAELNVKQKELPVEPEIIINPVRDFKASEINKTNKQTNKKQTNSKDITDLNITSQITKLLEENPEKP